MHKSVDSHIKLGMVDKAKAVPEEMDLLNHEEEHKKVMEDGEMPHNIRIGGSVAEDGEDDEEADDHDGDGLNLGPHKSVCVRR